MDHAPAVPVELRRVGGERALVRVERGGEQLEAVGLERDVVVQQQDVLGAGAASAPRL